MTSERLLRQYAPEECGPDGYPIAWHYGYGERPPIPGYEFVTEEEPPIKDLIRELAGHRCQRCGHPYLKGEHGNGEWSPCDERCTHGEPLRLWHPIFGREVAPVMAPSAVHALDSLRTPNVEARWRILTVHHLDEDKANCRWWNLVALCQRCHLRMQRAVVMDRPWHYEHSEWFKPHAAGFYAWKYLGEDLARQETLARLDELLALEHQGTRQALL